MLTPTLKLYGHDTSPYVRRIRVLLAELGHAFVRDDRSWTVADADVLRLNPALRVPAMAATVEGATTQLLLDSRIIASYVFSLPAPKPPAPPTGMPAMATTMFDARTRWDDENTLSVIDAAQDSLINLFVLELDGITRDRSAYLQRQMQRATDCLRWIDARLAGCDTFHEGVWSYLDIALACSADWMLFRERYPVLQHENLARVLAKHADRPSLSTTHPRLAASAALPKAGAGK